MSQYTRDGIKTKRNLYPWDNIERLTILGRDLERRSIKIRPNMPVVHSHSVGMITNSDVGRVLVVDVYTNGDVVDYFKEWKDNL